MRDSPKLLSLHLGMCTAALHGQAEAAQALTDMVRGIQMYMRADYKARHSQRSEVWRCGQTSLQQILRAGKNDAREAAERPACILVPSLINGSSILDLCEERSLAAWMTGQGMDVYLLDWGDLLQEHRDITLENLVSERLISAVRFLERCPGACALRPVHGLGYCMGGMLCLGAAFHEPGLFASLTLLASPWDFFAGEQRLLQHVRFWSPSAMAVMASKNHLSAESLQTLFAGLDPMLAQKKFARFSKMDMNSIDARIFVAVEDWLNDGKSLPHKIAQQCMVDWFLNNAPCAKGWVLGGRPVDIAALDIPLHIVASEKDQLVEFKSAMSIREFIPHADVTVPSCGHVGMIAGKSSIEEVWQPMMRWIKKQCET